MAIGFSLYRRIQRFRYEKSNGKKMGTFMGNPIFILHTMGRKTNKLRKSPLIYFKEGNDYFIVASNGGKDRNPAWYYNLLSMTSVKVQILDHVEEFKFKILINEEKEKAWQFITNKVPYYKNYPLRTKREIPIVRLNQL